MAQLSTPGLATLFHLDTTMLGGPVFFFTSAEYFDHAVFWGGQEYAPLPMQAGGFEMTTKGAIPTPSVTISNLYGSANLLLADYRGLLGAKLTRIITLTRFLDDGATPDPGAFITRDVYVVSQKSSHNAISVTFKLASQMDQEGVQLPRRQILRDMCSHVYRAWNPATGSFDYSKVSCPYTGGAFFDANNNPTSPDHDSCQRTLKACRLRFGNQPLPARFFPGVGRIK
jgi:lambda family phage minor tail protein L